MGKKQTILAVDDNELNLDILEEILAEDYDLSMAGSGEQALEMMSQSVPDLVLLDIMMPGISGYETCRRIKADAAMSQAKVILVSAKAMISERLEGYEVGADDYLTKPFEPDELLAKVRVFLRLKSAEEVRALRGELLNLVAHEIRTPLTGIIPAAEMLSQDGELAAEERCMWARMVLENGLRLLSLTEHGMLLCQFRAGDVILDLEHTELHALVRRVLGTHKPAAETLGYAFSVELPEDIAVRCDRRLTETAVHCLVESALRFASAGSDLTCTLSAVDDGTRLELRFPQGELGEESLRQLFEPFARREIDTEIVGSELALALAREIMRAHGGEVRAFADGDEVVFAAELAGVRAAAR